MDELNTWATGHSTRKLRRLYIKYFRQQNRIGDKWGRMSDYEKWYIDKGETGKSLSAVSDNFRTVGDELKRRGQSL